MDTAATVLDLERLDDYLFRGCTPQSSRGNRRVFGGQVAAQALVAAGRTVVIDRPVHSLHAYFLRPGDPTRPIVYRVDPSRDGGTYATRRVVATQGREAIFHLAASFQEERDGGIRHQVPVLDAPDPGSLTSMGDLRGSFDERTDAWIERMQGRYPIDMRFVEEPLRVQVSRGQRPAPFERVWLRCTDALPDEPLAHAAMAAFSSDLLLLASAAYPHGLTIDLPDVTAASLDHAVWFHRPFRADDWFLYEMESTWAAGGRAMCLGRMFTPDGVLVAQVMQEGLLSRRSTIPKIENAETLARSLG